MAYKRQRCPTRRSQLGFLLVGRNRALLGGEFSPRDWFKASEPGAIYDQQNLASLYQESTGVTPVYQPGQGSVDPPVGLMLDSRFGLVRGSEIGTYSAGFPNTTGITVFSATVAVSGTDLVVTSTGAAGGNYAVVPVATLVVDKSYEITVRARRGAQGTRQDIAVFSFATISARAISSTSTLEYTWRVKATATAATMRIYAAYAAGAVGDSAIVESISVREIPGAHQLQSTAGSRTVLSGRYNLLTKTEQFDDAAWGKVSSGTGSIPVVTANAATAPDGTLTADKVAFDSGAGTAGTDLSSLETSVTGTSGISYLGAIYVKAFAAGDIGKKLALRHVAAAAYTQITLTADWQRVSSTELGTGGATKFRVALVGNVTGATSSTASAYIWGADLRLTADAALSIPAYQRVDTASTYDTAGFPLYLKTDGFDDGYASAAIDFSGTDKMTVVAGITKLSDAAAGVLTELSSSVSSNNGAFLVDVPDSAVNRYGFISKGTGASFAGTNSASFVSPHTAVLCGIGDIVGDSAVLRINGASIATAGTDQGTGNYSNAVLYLFRRAGTTLPFNGRFYGAIVCGAARTAAQIAQAERWMAKRMALSF